MDCSGGKTLAWRIGNNGNDTLAGQMGNDKLYGGTGADVFIFARGHGRDVIVDFVDNDDSIQLSGFGFSSATSALAFASQVAGDVEFRFASGERLIVEHTMIAMLMDDLLV